LYLFSFGFGIILPLLKDKNSDISKPNGYRAITLSPVIAKLFENILLLLYECELDINPLQFGFKKASSCSHAIFVLKRLLVTLYRRVPKSTVAFSTPVRLSIRYLITVCSVK